MSKKAVVLLSGGLDSTTTLALAKSEGFELYAISFAYGQRHKHELTLAARIAEQFGVREHHTANIDIGVFGTSALTDESIAVPKDRPVDSEDIPVTYVPARNTIFLSYALGWAEVLGAYDIFIGVNAMDYSGYPDCRPAFVEAFEKTANLATAYGVEEKQAIRIRAPLIDMTKAEIIRTGISHGVDYGMTSSCYDPADDGRACGRCDACQLRLKGFRENRMDDPVPYAS